MGRFSLQAFRTPPLTKEPSKGDFQPLLDKVASRLASWQVVLLSQGGRLVLTKSVLIAMPIYHLMALNPLAWVLKQIDKCRRAFLWKGSESVSGGSCMVVWSSVCRPLECGGLGIHNLSVLRCALRIWWLWLQRTWESRPWRSLACFTSRTERELFQSSISVKLGNAEGSFFWTDRWMDG